MKKAFVLWTGGKDSCLALHLAKQQGYDISALVTFTSPEKEFSAHPLNLIKKQADSIGIKSFEIPIKEPYRESYIKSLSMISKKLSSSVVVTGDIDLVDNLPNWISECCKEIGLSTLFPMWKWSRNRVMQTLIEEKIEAVISFLNNRHLSREWIGRKINLQLLKELAMISEDHGVDLAGENGEFHTIVTNSPLFSYPIPVSF